MSALEARTYRFLSFKWQPVPYASFLLAPCTQPGQYRNIHCCYGWRHEKVMSEVMKEGERVSVQAMGSLLGHKAHGAGGNRDEQHPAEAAAGRSCRVDLSAEIRERMRGLLKTCPTRKALAACSRLRVMCGRNRKCHGIHRAPVETRRTPLEKQITVPDYCMVGIFFDWEHQGLLGWIL